MMWEPLTESDNYFDDFTVGEVLRHGRGKTITDVDGVLLCNLVMNTADGHFNEHAMATSPFGRRIVFGGITAALVVGLASGDTSENASEELSIQEISLPNPVFHGDTIYAYTRVLAVESVDEESGKVTFEHWGAKPDDTVVCRVVRTVLLPTQAAARR